MPSPYTSRESIEDALELARTLGLPTREIPITGMMTAFQEALRDAFAGYSPDVTEENLQSRIAGKVRIDLCNKFRALPLAAATKSQIAAVYCQLAGGLTVR